MAGNKSVNELTNASALQDGDSLVVFQDGETKQMAGSVLRTYVENSAQPSVAAAAASAEAAEDSADAAEENALKAEGYAVGKQNGEPARRGQPYYQDNAAYYAVFAMQSMQQAGRSAADSELWAKGSHTGGETPSDTNNSKYWAEQAGTSAGAADSAATAAAASAQAAADSADAAQDVLDSIPPDYTEAVRRTLAAFPQERAEGSVVDFADGADGLPVADLTVQIEGVQAGEGDPSPDNIRPITGWTGATVTKRSANMCILSDCLPNKTLNKDTGEPYDASGYMTTDYMYVYGLQNVKVESLHSVGYRTFRVCAYDSNHAFMALILEETFPADIVRKRTVSIPAGAYYIRIGRATITEQYYLNVFEKEETISITFPTEAGTVYGGSLDVTTGVLTVRNKIVTINHVNYISLPSGYCMFLLGERGYAVANVGKSNILRRVDSVSTEFDVFNVQNSSAYNRDQVAFRLSGIDITTTTETLSAVNAKLDEFVDAGTPLQVLYELTTPESYQLAPTEITTLLGWNTLYADTGNLSAVYRADPKMYTDGRLAAVRKIISGVEDGFTATQNYAVGDFLIVGDALYRVTAAIVTGGSITPDTNVTATTVAEQLKALYASIS